MLTSSVPPAVLVHHDQIYKEGHAYKRGGYVVCDVLCIVTYVMPCLYECETRSLYINHVMCYVVYDKMHVL